ncbi:FliH/SctL family protein [Bacillota bacterium LX-D]|nr:FliH/SctL family protein [Bacillota bacterium LX-D]
MPSLYRVIKDPKIVDTSVREIELRQNFSEGYAENQEDPAIQMQMEHTRQECGKLLARAQADADHIIAQSKEEAISIKEEAYEQGRKEGFEAGYEKGFQAGQEVVEELQEQKKRTIAQLLAAYNSIYEETEESLINLALEIARKIINKKVELDDELIFSIAKNALREAHAAEMYILFVSPDDLAKSLEYKSELQSYIPEGASLQVIADGDLAKGNCRVETNLGYTDGTIEQQFKELRALFSQIVPEQGDA